MLDNAGLKNAISANNTTDAIQNFILLSGYFDINQNWNLKRKYNIRVFIASVNIDRKEIISENITPTFSSIDMKYIDDDSITNASIKLKTMAPVSAVFLL